MKSLFKTHFLFLVSQPTTPIKAFLSDLVRHKKMSRGPSFKPGDRVVFRSNPLNREAVARGQVKRVIVEDSTTASTTAAAVNTQQQKYVVKNTATGKESILSVQEIISRQ